MKTRTGTKTKTSEPTLCYPRGYDAKTQAPHPPGKLTGGERACTLEGCRGKRIGVRWDDGKLTWPCTRGMFIREDGQWQIA